MYTVIFKYHFDRWNNSIKFHLVNLMVLKVFSRGVKLKKSKMLWFRAPLWGSQNWNPMVKMCSKMYFI